MGLSAEYRQRHWNIYRRQMILHSAAPTTGQYSGNPVRPHRGSGPIRQIESRSPSDQSRRISRFGDCAVMPCPAAGRAHTPIIERLGDRPERGGAGRLDLAHDRQHVGGKGVCGLTVRRNALGLRLRQVGPVSQLGALCLLLRQRRAGPVGNQPPAPSPQAPRKRAASTGPRPPQVRPR